MLVRSILNISLFIGKPVIAIIIGFITSLFLPKNKNSREVIINNTLKSVAPILFITAAGGVLGKVIIYSGFIDIIKNNSSTLIHLGFFFPFLIAAFIKSAQGSSTVAMITTASIMGIFQDSQSVISTLGFDTPFLAALTIASIGAGSMVVSHANDSYFWVVTGFTDISTKDGYRSQTIMSLINGIGALVGVYVLYGIWIVVHPQ